ncbi:MAG: DUF4864 domain-containing protein [Pseudomonadota bacterium]
MVLKPFTAAAMLAAALTLTPATVSAQDVPSAKLQQLQMVIDNQITAFRTQKHEQAFSYAAPRLQTIFGSTERFIGMVKSGYGAIYGARNWQFGRSRQNGTSEVWQEVRLTGPQGRDWVALYTMRQMKDGTWRIAGVQIKKAEELST